MRVDQSGKDDCVTSDLTPGNRRSTSSDFQNRVALEGYPRAPAPGTIDTDDLSAVENCWHFSGSQVASDDQPLDLIRSLHDLKSLCLPHVALYRVFLDIAVTTVDLDGISRDPHGDV